MHFFIQRVLALSFVGPIIFTHAAVHAERIVGSVRGTVEFAHAYGEAELPEGVDSGASGVFHDGSPISIEFSYNPSAVAHDVDPENTWATYGEGLDLSIRAVVQSRTQSLFEWSGNSSNSGVGVWRDTPGYFKDFDVFGMQITDHELTGNQSPPFLPWDEHSNFTRFANGLDNNRIMLNVVDSTFRDTNPPLFTSLELPGVLSQDQLADVLSSGIPFDAWAFYLLTADHAAMVNGVLEDDENWYELAASLDFATFEMHFAPGLCDVDRNGACDANDIDAMTQKVVDGIDTIEGRTVLIEGAMPHGFHTYLGDSNLDGVFDSGDFVDAFAAGKYEADELAKWNEGDWNGDERFDTTDFVAAFQGGGYEMGARTAVATVPEPSSWALLTLGVWSAGCIRRR